MHATGSPIAASPWHSQVESWPVSSPTSSTSGACWRIVPAKAANADAAKKFVAFATSPEIQAEGIVKTFNWYPGIDAEHIQEAVDEATWDKLFADVSPEELATKGQAFPIGPYFDDILEAYERNVEN